MEDTWTLDVSRKVPSMTSPMTSFIKMESAVKLEFLVEMSCDACAATVSKALQGREGVEVLSIDVSKQQVLVASSVPAGNVQGMLEATGKRAVLQGFGSGQGLSVRGLGAAVAMMGGTEGAVAGAGPGDVVGVTRLIQQTEQQCIVEGTLDGLAPGTDYTLTVNEYGDLSQGCHSCGGVFQGVFPDPSAKAAYGYLGTVAAGEDGRATFRLSNPTIKVWDVIGRSLCISAGDNKLACGIIARSSGLFENTKRVCACDGVTVWDERNKPVAGASRSNKV